MSRTIQPISIGTEHPIYYTELLNKTPRLANRRSHSDERSSPDLPRIHGVDDSLRTLLDVVANISLCQRGNVAATTVCLKKDKDTLETRLYIAFDHQDENAGRCRQHILSIFAMLRQIPYKPLAINGSPKAISSEFESNIIEVSSVIHNYSFDIFAHRVTKRQHKLSEIRSYIEQDRTHFKPEHRSTLLGFLEHVDHIIDAVAEAQATKNLSTDDVQILLHIHTFWTQNNLLPKIASADNTITLLDDADSWLAVEHHIGFQLKRWALKIMSFMISAIGLFKLTQSPRLRKLLDGKLSVNVLTSPTTTPYRCNLSSHAIRVALDAALADTSYRTAKWDEARESFIERLREELGDSEVVRQNPTVHAELAMIVAMTNGEAEDVLPYIGVSKLSCIMCSHYISTFREVTGQWIVSKGSHGKAYPGWFWPSLSGDYGELRPAFLKAIRGQLLSDFEQHAETWKRLRRNSDSSVGSDLTKVDLHPTWDSILEMFERSGIPPRANAVGL